MVTFMNLIFCKYSAKLYSLVTAGDYTKPSYTPPSSTTVSGNSYNHLSAASGGGSGGVSDMLGGFGGVNDGLHHHHGRSGDSFNGSSGGSMNDGGMEHSGLNVGGGMTHHIISGVHNHMHAAVTRGGIRIPAPVSKSFDPDLQGSV